VTNNEREGQKKKNEEREKKWVSAPGFNRIGQKRNGEWGEVGGGKGG